MAASPAGRAGAEAPPGGLSIGDRTLQTLSNHLTTARRIEEDSTKLAEGTLGYLNKNDPRFLVAMARGMDTHNPEDP